MIEESAVTDSIKFAIGESSPVKVRFSLMNVMQIPRLVSRWTRWRRSSRFRASRSMLCTTTVSPSRTKDCSASSSGRRVSLPEALSVNTLSNSIRSNCRSGFWSKH